MADLSNSFPDHNIDPRLKDFSWILQYARAAWANGSNNSFYKYAARYSEIRKYALGKQTISKYKKQEKPDQQRDNSSQNLDQTVVPIIPQFRNKSLAKLLQRKFDINAFAVNESAKTEVDQDLNRIRVKIAMREALQQAGSPLADSPMFAQLEGEPADLEQLEIMLQFGFKHNICMQAEMAVDWLFNYNQFERERGKVIPDQYDFGAGGYKVFIDENGKPRFRAVNLDNLIVSYCVQPDFSDASFIGEAIQVNVSDLVPYFDKGTIDLICKSTLGVYGNPANIDYSIKRYYDNFKVQVCDLEFISWNTTVFESNVDKFGNSRFGKTEFSNAAKVGNKGEAEPKYMSNTKKVVYQAKWLVGTNYMYDYGLAKNQVRKPSSWVDTQMGYVLEAWNFDKMQFTGITEGLIPLADDYYQTLMKLQNIKRKLIPYMIKLDIDGLENTNFGNAGDKFSPKDALELLLNSHVLVYRGKDLVSNNNQIAPPASIDLTGMAQEIVYLRNELISIKNEMMEISGYNSVSIGNPDPKLLNAGYQSANAATNDSLWLISEADKRLTLRLADLLIQKTQIAVKLGKIEGYSNAIGSSGVKMFSLTPDISLHEFAIFLDDAATQQERQELMMELSKFDQQGLLEPQDKFTINNCRNLKQAEMLLSYLVGKRKKEQQDNAMQQQQMNGQVQQQSAMAAEQAKQQTMQMEFQLKAELLNQEKHWDYMIKGLSVEGAKSAAQISAEAKIIQQQIIEQSKGASKQMDYVMHDKKLMQDASMAK